MRRRWPLTLRGTGAVALGTLCLVLARELGVVELTYLGILLLAVVVVSFVSLYAVRRTDRVTRSLAPDVVSVGADAAVTVRAGVRSVLPTAPGRWHDELPPALDGRARGVFPALGSALRGGERVVVVHYVVTGRVRGIHAIGPLRVTATDPFGLTRRSHVFRDTTPVTVAPAIVDLPPIVDYAGEAGGALHTATTQLGQGADNLVARPYLPGDSMRRIHWRASAHSGDLMVRQEEQESTPEATVVLDRSVLRWTNDALRAPGADPGFEEAVSAAVSTVVRLAQDGYAVELIDAHGTELVPRIDRAEAADVAAVARSLATLVARRDDALPHVRRQFAGTTTGPLVLIAGRFDEADAATIAPIAPHSTLPVLIVTGPVGAALEHARQAGWHPISLSAPDREGEETGLALGWSAAVSHGVGRVFG